MKTLYKKYLTLALILICTACAPMYTIPPTDATSGEVVLMVDHCMNYAYSKALYTSSTYGYEYARNVDSAKAECLQRLGWRQAK